MRPSFNATLIAVALATVLTGPAFAQSGTKPAAAPASQSSEAKQMSEGSASKSESGGTVYADAKSARPMKAGDKLPAIAALQNAKGESVNLAEATKGKTSVLIFYRGGWCPYCNTHLAELAKIQPELAAKGVQIIAISPDSAETVAKQTMEKPLPYTVLSDSKHAAAKAMGVAFAVDAETQGKLKGYGIDLVKASGNPDQILPVPAVFVLNPEGLITFAHVNPDYTKRLSGQEVLAAATTPMPMEGSAPKTEAGSAAKPTTPKGSTPK